MSSRISAVLGLGSNLGRKGVNLCTAIRYLSSFCEIEAVSYIYKTASLLKDDQDSYFNLCVSVRTDMSEQELLRSIKSIEKIMGRKDSGRWYTRVMDIDIIDYDGKQYDAPNLKIPHPQMENRSFVLYPLMDIKPDYVHPVSCLRISDMVKSIKDNLGIQRLGEALWRL